jgi:peptidylprolyl isomerase
MGAVSNPGQTQQQTSTGPVRSPKREAKRALAREAAARRAAYKRRKLIRVWSGVAVVVLLLAGGVTYLLTHNSGNKPSATSSSSTSAEPSAAVSTPPALATKPTVTKGTGTLTKLNVTTLVQGTGPAVQAGQTITVNYVGVTWATGQEFDSSWKNGSSTSFPIGTGNVIPGWDQGLVGVKVGSRVQLDIPSNLAYGDSPSGGQPAGPLRFVVDILGASGAPSAPAT